MPDLSIRIEARPTFRDLQGRFAAAEEELLRARRNELRVEGRHLVDMTRKNLSDKIGPSKIEQGIRFNTRIAGDRVRLNVTAPSKARPHRIQARNASALSFFWPTVGMRVFVPRSGGFKTHVRKDALWIGKGHVDHPGGSLVPLIRPILIKTQREWMARRGRAALSRISTRYVDKVTGRR